MHAGAWEDVEFRIQLGLGFRIQGLGLKVQDLGFRIQGLGSRIQATVLPGPLTEVRLGVPGAQPAIQF